MDQCIMLNFGLCKIGVKGQPDRRRQSNDVLLTIRSYARNWPELLTAWPIINRIDRIPCSGAVGSGIGYCVENKEAITRSTNDRIAKATAAFMKRSRLDSSSMKTDLERQINVIPKEIPEMNEIRIFMVAIPFN